jgi:hypothetical protein
MGNRIQDIAAYKGGLAGNVGYYLGLIAILSGKGDI